MVTLKLKGVDTAKDVDDNNDKNWSSTVIERGFSAWCIWVVKAKSNDDQVISIWCVWLCASTHDWCLKSLRPYDLKEQKYNRTGETSLFAYRSLYKMGASKICHILQYMAWLGKALVIWKICLYFLWFIWHSMNIFLTINAPFDKSPNL